MVPIELLTPEALCECAKAICSQTKRFPHTDYASVLFDFCQDNGVARLARTDIWITIGHKPYTRTHQWLVTDTLKTTLTKFPTSFHHGVVPLMKTWLLDPTDKNQQACSPQIFLRPFLVDNNYTAQDRNTQRLLTVVTQPRRQFLRIKRYGQIQYRLLAALESYLPMPDMSWLP